MRGYRLRVAPVPPLCGAFDAPCAPRPSESVRTRRFDHASGGSNKGQYFPSPRLRGEGGRRRRPDEGRRDATGLAGAEESAFARRVHLVGSTPYHQASARPLIRHASPATSSPPPTASTDTPLPT